jgi:hypothetical protein
MRIRIRMIVWVCMLRFDLILMLILGLVLEMRWTALKMRLGGRTGIRRSPTTTRSGFGVGKREVPISVFVFIVVGGLA